MEQEIDFMECNYCGKDGCENWEYSGEGYDDGEHLGAIWRCEECGHLQCDNDPQQDFSMYDEY
jgi:hypothetical protein